MEKLDKRDDTMHIGWSITDELREFAPHLDLGKVALAGWKEGLLAIADRIDAEHEAKVSYWQGESYRDGYDDGFASADDWMADNEDAMAEHGWVRLPVDADGVPIRVGDVMEERSGHTFEVASLMAFGGSDNWIVLSDARNFSSFREPHNLRHHHAPTVEDVLREFSCVLMGKREFDGDVAEAIAEYSAKLRLAGDAE